MGEASVQELRRMWNIPSLPGPFCPEVVVPVIYGSNRTVQSFTKDYY